MTVAALARDDEVRYAFDKICWVSVGQEPDMPALQQTLHIQLVGRPLPEAAQADERVALEALKEAAGAATVLLVLDDVVLVAIHVLDEVDVVLVVLDAVLLVLVVVPVYVVFVVVLAVLVDIDVLVVVAVPVYIVFVVVVLLVPEDVVLY